MLVCHRRAGKTVASINDVVARALKEGKADGRYAYVAPYYSQAKAIAWDYLLHYSEPVRRASSATELSVELVNGARVRLYGADNPDALRGIYLDGALLDEYADFRPSVYPLVIRPMLMDRGGWTTWIGTPKGHNAFYEVRQQAIRERALGWYHLELKASSTGILSPQELADARRSMSADQFDQEFECSFEAAIPGAVWGKELREVEAAGRIRPLKAEPGVPVHTSWDLGRDDATAIWFWQTLRGEVRYLDYYENHLEDVEHYAAVVKARAEDNGWTYGDHWLPADAKARHLGTKHSVWEQLQANGVRPRAVLMTEVRDGIEAGRLVLERATFDAGNCERGLESLRMYQREYDEDLKRFKDVPRHDWASHGADAFRYSAVAWREARKAAPGPAKPKPGTFDWLTRDERPERSPYRRRA